MELVFQAATVHRSGFFDAQEVQQSRLELQSNPSILLTIVMIGSIFTKYSDVGNVGVFFFAVFVPKMLADAFLFRPIVFDMVFYSGFDGNSTYP